MLHNNAGLIAVAFCLGKMLRAKLLNGFHFSCLYFPLLFLLARLLSLQSRVSIKVAGFVIFRNSFLIP